MAARDNEITIQALAIQEELVWESCRSPLVIPERQSRVSVVTDSSNGRGEFMGLGSPSSCDEGCVWGHASVHRESMGIGSVSL